MKPNITAVLVEDREEIRKRIKAAGGPKDNAGFDTVVALDLTWVDVEEGGLGLVNTQRVVKALTDAGAADLGVLRFDYDPKSMKLDVTGLTVHRKDGSAVEVDVKDPSNFVDVPQPAKGMFWGPRMKVYRLPRIEEGDAVEIRTFRKGFSVAYLRNLLEGGDDEITPPMPGHFFEVYLFEENVPVKEKRYTIALPANKPIRSDIYHGEARVEMNFDEGQVRYTWVKKDVQPIKAEKRMAAEGDVKTKLVLATNRTWEEKSRWFYDANKNQFEWDDAIARKVAEVTEGLSTDEEKAEALLHWTAQQIRYIGFSLGKNEGFTIHPGKMTFHERGGVCKEFGGMLVTMLRAAGLESFPVMTQAGSDVEDVPADQFNHCFTAWRKKDGTFVLLDPTWAPFARETYCTAEQQQHFLIGTPEGQPLGRTPAKPPEASLLAFEGSSTLKADGGLESEVTITGNGRSDTNMRRAVALAPKPSAKAYMDKLAEVVAPGAAASYFEYSKADDFTRPQEYKLKISAAAHHGLGDGVMRFGLPLTRLALGPNFCRHLEIGDLDSRKHPAMLWYTQKITVDETVKLPRGYRLLQGAGSVKVERDTAAFEAAWRQDGSEVKASMTVEFKVRHLEPSAYPGFREVMLAVKAHQARTMIATRG